ncbi:hypothetical protein B9Z55_003524 [Caenorhabditis nigoni]|uniref:VWFA domain-containing protein n=1 Tax=Caenorhabditis nigoni TaxID=1611254 RepID=A0A2G5VR55_9PELO|nr:hypothetical protein B9Z55_003524 [Caenorhabditis nigoni]
MKTPTCLLVLLASVYADVYNPQSYTDRPCGDDLSNLWLDVIAVVDNSQGMTTDGLSSVAANIATVFSSGTRIGSSTTEPRTTRVGLITYNSVAKVNADLNTFQSIDDVYNGVFNDLSSVTDATDSYLATGLEAANQLFATQSFNTTRDHYKKVVIVYASEYKGYGELDPVRVADEMKGSGVYIVTVAYDQGGNGQLLKDLAGIATPGYSFSNTDDSDNVIGEIQGALLQANCFCPTDWDQYRVQFTDKNSYHYGLCLQYVSLQANWLSSKMACHTRWNNSYLATEFSQDKHDFILQVVKSYPEVKQPYKYNVGLSWLSSANNWVWEQPIGLEQVPLQVWSNWDKGYPKAVTTTSGVLNLQSGSVTYWENQALMTGAANYVCETYSCDTDNYCDAQLNKKH